MISHRIIYFLTDGTGGGYDCSATNCACATGYVQDDYICRKGEYRVFVLNEVWSSLTVQLSILRYTFSQCMNRKHKCI